jgi:DNA replication protein DnaC
VSSATPTRPAPARRISRSISIRACLAGQRVHFATATDWVATLGEAKRHGGLETELRRLSFVPLIVVDEVGYIRSTPRRRT